MASKKYKFYVINIKLQSTKSENDRYAFYDELITKLTEPIRFTRLNSTNAIAMFKPWHRDDNGVKYYYGRLGKGISFFDADRITVLNNGDMSTELVDKNRLLQPNIGNYIYIPSIHRFALLKEPNAVTVGDFKRFLSSQIPDFILADENIEVDFEKEPSIIDEIFSAQAVYSLSYQITYSNSDTLNAQGELFDEFLKDKHIGSLDVTAKSDHNADGMDVENVNFLGGGIEVARKNGFIRSARIKPADEERIRTVTNKDKPLVEELELQNDDDNLNEKWFTKLRRLYQ